MKPPELIDFGLSLESVENFNLKLKRFTRLFNHTIPMSVGAILGIVLYIFYYHPFSQPDIFQIIISFFVFGGFGILFLGIPLMVFKILYKLFFKYYITTNKIYISIQNFNSAKHGFEVWNMRNNADFWKSLDPNSLINEMVKLLKKEDYYIISDSVLSYKKFDIVVHKDFQTIPVLCISQKKSVGLKTIRSFLKTLDGLNINEKIIVSVSGFTNQSKKFSNENNIKLIGLNDIIELNKNHLKI